MFELNICAHEHSIQLSRVVNNSGIESDSGIEIRFRNQNRNQSLVCWNQNWNRNQMMQEKESELESGLVESKLESESLVPESFTTLQLRLKHSKSNMELASIF